MTSPIPPNQTERSYSDNLKLPLETAGNIYKQISVPIMAVGIVLGGARHFSSDFRWKTRILPSASIIFLSGVVLSIVGNSMVNFSSNSYDSRHLKSHAISAARNGG